MILDQRVISNATDISTLVNDYRIGTAAFVYTLGQYLYVGSILPFNNLWFEMGTANVTAATVAIDIWYSNAWSAAVDILDETSGLTATGRIQWNTNRLKGWDRQLDSSDVTGLPAASRIYDFYWLRLSWSATFSAGSSLKYIGQKFGNDDILYSFYPDLNNTNIRGSFETGKTTWDEQHYMAAEHIVRDLKKSDIIKARAQILDYGLLVDAACHKVAMIVYQAFGEPYADQLKRAGDAYKDALNIKNFNVDKTQDGRLDDIERVISTAYMGR